MPNDTNQQPHGKNKKTRRLFKHLTIILVCLDVILIAFCLFLSSRPRLIVTVRENAGESSSKESTTSSLSSESIVSDSSSEESKVNDTPIPTEKPTNTPKPTKTPTPTAVPSVKLQDLDYVSYNHIPLREDDNPEVKYPHIFERYIGSFALYSECSSSSKTYTGGVFGGNVPSNGENFNTYNLNGEYKTIKGTIFYNEEATYHPTETDPTYFRIYGYDQNGKQILSYQSPNCNREGFPDFDFDESVSNVYKLKITIQGSNYIRLANCVLTK